MSALFGSSCPLLSAPERCQQLSQAPAGLKLTSVVPCPAWLVLAVRQDQRALHGAPRLTLQTASVFGRHRALVGPRETLRKLAHMDPSLMPLSRYVRHSRLRAALRALTLPGLQVRCCIARAA